jgi:hypothetical protein
MFFILKQGVLWRKDPCAQTSLNHRLIHCVLKNVIIFHYEQVPRPTTLLNPLAAETTPLPGPMGLLCISLNP